MEQIGSKSIQKIANCGNNDHQLVLEWYGPAEGPFWNVALMCLACATTLIEISDQDLLHELNRKYRKKSFKHQAPVGC